MSEQTPAEQSLPADDASAIWQWISQARWFSGKGRGGHLASVQVLDWMGSSEGALRVRPEIATIAYPDGSVEYYQLLCSYRPEPLDAASVGRAADASLGWRHDAARDPEAMELVVQQLLHHAEAPTWQAVLNDRLEGDLTARVFTGEQSNTNVMLGDIALLKVFRKLEPGRNLDIQVHDALGRSGVHSVAHLYGWVSSTASSVDGQPTTFDLMMLVEQLRGVEDGWELAVEAARTNTDFSEHAARLGRALRTIHDALVDTFPTQNLDGSDVRATMEKRLDAAIEAAPVLAPHRDDLVAVFAQLDGQRLRGQRIHGDFHLGQTLHLTGAASGGRESDGSWRIIDFEGEPMKQMWERVLPDSRWRDVAGMLRSFSYATSGHAEPLGEQAQAWLRSCREAFLDAYAGRVSDQDAAILAAYEADKAVYEVVYEARNRPDWLGIPMSGLEQLVATRRG